MFGVGIQCIGHDFVLLLKWFFPFSILFVDFNSSYLIGWKGYLNPLPWLRLTDVPCFSMPSGSLLVSSHTASDVVIPNRHTAKPTHNLLCVRTVYSGFSSSPPSQKRLKVKTAATIWLENFSYLQSASVPLCARISLGFRRSLDNRSVEATCYVPMCERAEP